MGIGYARERLSTAVGRALLQEGSFQRRLAAALSGNIALLHSSHRDLLPAEVQEKFDALWEACTRKSDPTGKRPPTEVTTGKMNDAEARGWLGKLFTLYVAVAEHLYPD